MHFLRLAALAVIVLSCGVVDARAQSFNQEFVFGDSTVDAGWWRGAFATPPNCNGAPGSCTPTGMGNSNKDNAIRTSLGEGATGTPSGAGNQMNSQLLGSYFGLSVNPVNSPGGTDYAVSGSVDSSCVGPCDGTATHGTGNLNANRRLPSTTQQISTYLDQHGGVANASALYYISSGGNDITFANEPFGPPDAHAFLADEAQALTTSVADLKAAGAKYFVVDSSDSKNADSKFYTATLWSDLSRAGVNFVPVNVFDMISYVETHPTQFGFSAATVMPGVKGTVGNASTGSACVWVTPTGGPTDGWGQWCAKTTTPSTSQAYLASADAEQKYFFSDDQHLSAAGQKIEADYIYSLITAPSEISYLAEDAIKARATLVNNIQTELDFGKQTFGPSGFNAWVIGDVSHLEMDHSSSGFPDDPGTPVLVTAGLSYKVSDVLIVGTALSTGTERSGFSLGGDFDQSEVVGSLYAAFNDGHLWSNVIGSYGGSHYDVNRVVPIGISIQNNEGNTDGSDWSIAAQAGYNFHVGGLTHGPLAGVLWQHDNVDGFTESGSFTSLGFDEQHRESAVGSLGYKASLHVGLFEPFAQLEWNHEFADTDRSVTAFLAASSVIAPSYSMPGVILGKDWGEGEVGTTMDVAPGITALAAFTGDFAQKSASMYGGQFGLNVAF